MQFLRTNGRVLGSSTLRRLNTGHVRVSAVPLRTFITLQAPRASTLRSMPTVFRAPLKNFQGVFTKRFSSTVAIPHVEKIREATQVIASKPIVAYWLYFNAGLIFAIVVVGGLTRLTESGLSITEWNVISGMKPPRSQEEWEEEFEKYKQFPEYKM
jgi:Cytochrome oxidase assembly protein